MSTSQKSKGEITRDRTQEMERLPISAEGRFARAENMKITNGISVRDL